MDICNIAVNSDAYNRKSGMHITLYHMDIYAINIDVCCGVINETANIYSPVYSTVNNCSPVYRTVTM